MHQEFDKRKESDKGKGVVSVEDKTMVDNKEKMQKNCYAKQALILTLPLLTSFVSDATLVSMQPTVTDSGRLKMKVRDERAETEEGACRLARKEGKATKTSN